MLFDLFLVREAGWIMPRWRTSVHPGIRGNLHVFDQQGALLNRVSRVAELRDVVTGRPIASVQPLRDAVLLRFEQDYFVLSGLERKHDPILNRYYDYAQTWLLEPVIDP